jgi:predicted AlkP superfamily phosphohydrolase/phosphomutase
MAVIMLGLDGMNLNLLEYCKDDMKNLSDLLNESAYSTAKSIFPALSGPAWVSILTGQGVGTHGFLNSFFYDKDMKVKINNPDEVIEEHFYEAISKLGEKIFLMDVPFSTSKNIPGDFLDSYFSNKSKDELIVPPNLVEKFVSIKNYVNYKKKSKNINDYLRSFKDIVLSNGQIIKDVVNSKEYGFMFFQITVADWIQHKALVDIKHNRNTQKAQISREVLCELDKLIGWIKSQLNKDDHLVIFSDHGGAELDGTFFINTWLKKNGFLKIKKNQNNRGSNDLKDNVKNFKNVAIQKITKFAKTNRILLNLAKPIHRKLRKFIGKDVSSIDEIDHNNSKAVCLIKNIPIIKIFEQDLEKKNNIRDELVNKINNDLGFKVTDILEYYGCLDCDENTKNKLRKFGDLVVDIGNYELDVFLGNKVFLKGESMFHDENAIFIANGPKIKPGKIEEDVSIVDFCPTILHLFDIFVPLSKDGKVLDIFKDEFKFSKSINEKKLERKENSSNVEELANQVDF